MFSLKNVKKQLVLLCFRSTMLKNHWFYCVFAQKCWKSIGFTSKEALKPKKHWFYSVPYVNEYKKVKKWKNVCFSREKFSACLKQYTFFDFSENPRWILKQLLRPRAGWPCWPRHGLCVFLCTPSLMLNENPKKYLLLGKKTTITTATT